MTVHYTIIVDTNAYSGNFEREMCAFITGQLGECGVGAAAAACGREALSQEMLAWFEDHTDHRDDENGYCMRPCVIKPTPHRVNDGYGGHFDAATYTGKHSYSAYESVGILLTKKPTQAIMALVNERAKAFALQYKDGQLAILNVRLTKNLRKEIDVDIASLK